MKRIWQNKNISLTSKIKLMYTLVISIFLHACVSWTRTVDPQRCIDTLKMRCYHKILNISYWDPITNEEVRKRITTAFGLDSQFSIVKKRKIMWYGHVMKLSGIAKIIQQVTVLERRWKDRQKKKKWEDNIQE